MTKTKERLVLENLRWSPQVKQLLVKDGCFNEVNDVVRSMLRNCTIESYKWNEFIKVDTHEIGDINTEILKQDIGFAVYFNYIDTKFNGGYFFIASAGMFLGFQYMAGSIIGYEEGIVQPDGQMGIAEECVGISGIYERGDYVSMLQRIYEMRDKVQKKVIPEVA